MKAEAAAAADAAAHAKALAAEIEGPSYPPLVKLLASALVLTIVVLALQQRQRLVSAALPWAQQALLLAAVAVVFCTFWALLRSRTSMSGTHIHQRWLWHKQVALADIVQVKVLRVRGLDWLITPRLVVRARGVVGVVSFPTADTRVLAAFELFARGGPGLD